MRSGLGGVRKGAKRSANHFVRSLGGTFGVWLCYQLIKAENEKERDCFNPVMDVAVRQIVKRIREGGGEKTHSRFN